MSVVHALGIGPVETVTLTEDQRESINGRIVQHVYHSGYYDSPLLVANYKALSRSPWLSEVIEPKDNTYVLRELIPSESIYGDLGELIRMLDALDDYPVIDDEILWDMTHEELIRELGDYTDKPLDVAQFIYECGNSTYLEEGMTVAVEIYGNGVLTVGEAVELYVGSLTEAGE